MLICKEVDLSALWLSERMYAEKATPLQILTTSLNAAT